MLPALIVSSTLNTLQVTVLDATRNRRQRDTINYGLCRA